MSSNLPAVWSDESKIKAIALIKAPEITEDEFSLYLSLGRASGLNPFLNEIWCVKYDKKSAASIFIGRDGYRKIAQSLEEYDYHNVQSIYSKDDFQMIDGVIHHKFNFMDRGLLVGAYCVVKRRHSSKEMNSIVSMKEYAKPFGVWKTMPEVMIKKVAEATALRQAFQSTFGGTYSEYEAWEEPKPTVKECLTVEPAAYIEHEQCYPTEKETLEAMDSKDLQDIIFELLRQTKSLEEKLVNHISDSAGTIEELNRDEMLNAIALLQKKKAKQNGS